MVSAEEDLAHLLGIIAERHSGCAQAIKRRKKLQDPECRSPRVFDAGFHAGWEALRGWLLETHGANIIPGQLDKLKAERADLKERLRLVSGAGKLRDATEEGKR